MITSSDITAQIIQISEACDGSYDVQGVAADLIAEFDLIGDAPTQTLADIDDVLWTAMALHELGNPTMAAPTARTRTMRVKKMLSGLAELSSLKVTSTPGSHRAQVTYVHLPDDTTDAVQAVALTALCGAFPEAEVELAPGYFFHIKWAPGLW